MTEDLKRIDGKPFKSYIGDNFPTKSEVDFGELTIIDNTDIQSIKGLIPGTYNLFVDHIHIASGYGFNSYEAFFTEAEHVSYSYNNIIKLLNDQEENKNLHLVEIINNQNNNYFSTYNSCGFQTSISQISVDQNVNGNAKYSYQLNISSYELSYILPIDVRLHEDTIIVNKGESFPIDIKISKYTGNNNISQIISHEKIRINETELESLASNNSTDGYTTYLFEPTDNIYSKDFKVEYIFEEIINGQNKKDIVVGTYVMPNLLKWGETIHIYPTDNIITNNLIFDDGILSDDNNIGSILQQLLGELSGDQNYNNHICISPEELTDITFSSGEIPLYDQIIINNNKDIEFYYNGIKSNNWDKYIYNYNNSDYTIWTSPQKYRGAHTWQIKINK